MENIILSGILRLLLLTVIIVSFAISVFFVIKETDGDNLKRKVLGIINLLICSVLLFFMFFVGTKRVAPVEESNLENQIRHIVEYVITDDYNYYCNPKYFANDFMVCYMYTDSPEKNIQSEIEVKKDDWRSIYKSTDRYIYLLTPLESVRSAESFYSHENYAGELFIMLKDQIIVLKYSIEGKYDKFGFVGSLPVMREIDFDELISQKNELVNE